MTSLLSSSKAQPLSSSKSFIEDPGQIFISTIKNRFSRGKNINTLSQEDRGCHSRNLLSGIHSSFFCLFLSFSAWLRIHSLCYPRKHTHWHPRNLLSRMTVLFNILLSLGVTKYFLLAHLYIWRIYFLLSFFLFLMHISLFFLTFFHSFSLTFIKFILFYNSVFWKFLWKESINLNV